ncbi:hypothetical protein MMC29_004737 [Sticta canariensis]|nr:hypothetical protein [Sticta canariensis]
MSSELRIPTITQVDLRAFRVRNFPSNAKDPENHDRGAENFDEDDCSLGFYPDGVQRTLTDEQIAMFRHSEIYALYRERQIRKENLEAGFEPQPESPAWGASSAIGTTATSTREGQNAVLTKDDSDDEEEYARFLEAEKRKADAMQMRKKRKMNHENSHENRGRPATHRRIARELDIVVEDQQVLDYGEEPSKTIDISKTTPIQKEVLKDDERKQQLQEPSLSTLQKEVLKDDERKQQLQESSLSTLQKDSPPVEGRKVWWPAISI